MTQSVVFILGSTRSGTSAVRNALWETRYKGPGEGHLIGLVRRVAKLISGYYEEYEAAALAGTFLSNFSESEMKEDWYELVRNIYKKVSGSEWIIDKTPTIEPLLSISTIREIWPTAAFIFCKRRGIENILSKQRKFPNTSFIDHCREWTALMDAWEMARGTLDDSCLEIEHYYMLRQPDITSSRLSYFLNLTNEEERAVCDYLMNMRPEATAAKDDSRESMSLGECGWSEREQELFTDVCGGAMARGGYGMQRYWIEDEIEA